MIVMFVIIVVIIIIKWKLYVLVFIIVDIVQILYKDSEHVDSAAAGPDASTNTDDGGALCFIQLSHI